MRDFGVSAGQILAGYSNRRVRFDQLTGYTDTAMANGLNMPVIRATATTHNPKTWQS